jgi:hypothetical protein
MTDSLPNAGDPVVAPGAIFSPGPPVGSAMPDIVLPDQDGRVVDLHADRAGRRALLLFHRSADW